MCLLYRLMANPLFSSETLSAQSRVIHCFFDGLEYMTTISSSSLSKTGFARFNVQLSLTSSSNDFWTKMDWMEASMAPLFRDWLVSVTRKAFFSESVDTFERVSNFGFNNCLGLIGCTKITESGEWERGRRRQERDRVVEAVIVLKRCFWQNYDGWSLNFNFVWE